MTKSAAQRQKKNGDGKRVELMFPEDDECVQIAIVNGGCTLGKDDLPHIFESFWRGANTENIRGSGLGIYICSFIFCINFSEALEKI